jgi:hypothetical protein
VDAQTKRLIDKLETFEQKYIGNPAAKREFYKLLMECRNFPSFDHADYDLISWVENKQYGK